MATLFCILTQTKQGKFHQAGYCATCAKAMKVPLENFDRVELSTTAEQAAKEAGLPVQFALPQLCENCEKLVGFDVAGVP